VALVGVVFKRPLTTIYHYETESYADTVYKRVMVSLGSKSVLGYAIPVEGLPPQSVRLKKIEKILDEVALIDETSVVLAKWISDYTFCSLGEALALFFPFASYASPLKPKKEKLDLALPPRRVIDLTSEQETACQAIFSPSSKPISLLHGITGSGKTHVYAEVARRTLARGKQVLVIVPEIALTPQTALFFEEILGQRIAVIHSLLTVAAKYLWWKKIAKGEVTVVLGTRSALFAPLRNLGLVIIDEEHDGSYKNGSVPRYHAKALAQQLIKVSGARLILGSATPSFESFYQASLGNIALVPLKFRHGGTELPTTEVVAPPNAKELMLSEKVINEIQKTCKTKNQVIIYLNKKGYAGIRECLECGHVETCPRCSVSLTEFSRRGVLHCHYCGFAQDEKNCSHCGSLEFENRNWGTERLQEELRFRLPHLVVEKMDSDLFRLEKKTQTTFKNFKTGKIDVLIGTQILAKGHDFPGVQLVVVLNPENHLALPDFRSSERGFSLLTQVIGRAGRRETQGTALIVCRRPDHPAIQSALKQDYEGFYQKEVEIRKKLIYPPFGRIFRMVFRGVNASVVKSEALRCADSLVKFVEPSVKLLGPTPCLMEKIKDQYRWHLVLKIQSVLQFQKDFAQFRKEWVGNKKVYMEIDMDPVEIV
jgi:primosomal protein N' (replication factor Y)